MSAWQRVFLQSRVNKGVYNETGLAPQYWDWPQGTWFQKRLAFLREKQRHQTIASKAG
jgi:hypothetical protein